MSQLQRKYNYTAGTNAKGKHVREDLQQIIDRINTGMQSDNIANDAVTDNHIGDRTVDQTTAVAFANTGKLTQLLSWIVKDLFTLKGSGITNWYDSAVDTIKGLSDKISNLAGTGRTTETVKATYDSLVAHEGNSANPHSVTAAQVNAYTKTELQTSGDASVHWGNLTNIPNLADSRWKNPVSNVAALPLSGNTVNDMRVVVDDGDGKSAMYRCKATVGIVSDQWEKIADLDWTNNHDSLVNLANDSHTQYLNRSGVRAMTGDLDFAKNKALRLVEDQGIAFPSSPVVGQRFYRTDLYVPYMYKGVTRGWEKSMGAQPQIKAMTASTTGTETFDISDVGQYEVGTQSLLVFVAGAFKVPTELSSTTFSVSVTAGQAVVAWWLENSPEVINNAVQKDGTLKVNLNAEMLDGAKKADLEAAAKAYYDSFNLRLLMGVKFRG